MDINKINKFISQGETLLGKNFTNDEPEFKAWKSSILRFYESQFGNKSSLVIDLRNRFFGVTIYFDDMDPAEDVRNFERDVKTTILELKSILEDNVEAPNKSLKQTEINNNKVFIVHGQDEKAKLELQVFLLQQGLNPIILHEQTNKGQTIIEKFETNSDVSCAIILLTPDDVGKINDDSTELKTRARQNVVFEAGYFMGKLGRNRVILINGVEDKMSDIQGVVYLDLKNYKIDLLKELKELGLIKK